MPDVEIYSYDFSYLDPTERFLFHVQVTEYQNRIEIIENVALMNGNENVFHREYTVYLINERDLIVICSPESDVFNVE